MPLRTEKESIEKLIEGGAAGGARKAIDAHEQIGARKKQVDDQIKHDNATHKVRPGHENELLIKIVGSESAPTAFDHVGTSIRIDHPHTLAIDLVSKAQFAFCRPRCRTRLRYANFVLILLQIVK